MSIKVTPHLNLRGNAREGVRCSSGSGWLEPAGWLSEITVHYFR
jgi:hypothetical protein